MFYLQQVDSYPVIAIDGDVDLSNVRELEAALDNAAQINIRGLVVDLTNVKYFGSRTVHILLRFNERLRINRKKMVVVRPSSPSAIRLMEITGLISLLSNFEDMSKAVQTLNEYTVD